MVCFDTSFLVDLIRRNPSAETKLQFFLDRGDSLTTTPVTAAELFEGAYSSKKSRVELERVRGLLEHLELLALSIPVCERYGQLVNEMRSTESPIGDLDTLIASAAIVNRTILLTKDRKHFDRVPGLVVQSW